MQEKAGDMGLIPGLERSLEEEMVTRSSILAWEIPWIKEPGVLEPIVSQRAGHDWAPEHVHTHAWDTRQGIFDIDRFTFHRGAYGLKGSTYSKPVNVSLVTVTKRKYWNCGNWQQGVGDCNRKGSLRWRKNTWKRREPCFLGLLSMR